MTGTVLLALAGVGLVVGLVSGLIGVGGGVLIVPFLYFFYAHPAWSGVGVTAELEATVAHATSLFIIVPTALGGVITYHRAGLVSWRTVLPVAASAIVGAVIGARLAVLLPAPVLKLGFGLVLLASAAQLLTGGPPSPRKRLRLSTPLTIAVGLAIGTLSALMGVGGGVIAVPLLIYAVGLGLDRVAATSLGVIVFAATAGVLTYIATGWGRPDLPAGSLGYVHTFAALPILAGSLLSVRWGAILNQRMRSRALGWVFGVCFILLGLRLIVQNAPLVF